MFSKVKITLFDLDNTLYRQSDGMNDEIQSFIAKRASEILNQPYDKVKEEYISTYNRIQSARRTLIGLGIPQGADLVQEALENADISKYLEYNPGLVHLFDKLNQQYKTILVTGSGIVSATQKLDKLGISNVFHETYYADFEKKREDGSFFQYIMEKHAVQPQELCMVGDREKVDIIPATKMGIPTVMVHGNSSHATVSLESIHQLKDYLL